MSTFGQVIQRTIFDEEIGTVVWTRDFDEKHFAATIEEAKRKAAARLKRESYKRKVRRLQVSIQLSSMIGICYYFLKKPF